MRFRLVAALCVAATFAAPFACGSEVVYSTESSSIRDGIVQGATVRRMVDGIVIRLTGKRTVAEAWRTWIRPTDRVGIKVATSAGRPAGVHPAVVDAVVAGLREAGVPPANIIVWDRRLEDLQVAGFSRSTTEYTLRWIEGGAGYDETKPLTLPVLGKLIAGDFAFENRRAARFKELFRDPEPLSDESHFTRILTRDVDKIINIPSLTDSFLTGVAGAIPNLTIGNMDNWRRFTKPPLFGAPYIAEIYAEPLIRDKVVVHLLDALYVQYAGGPFPDPNNTRPHFAIFGSTDPVALDALAVKLIDEYRLPAKLPALKASADYVKSAAELGLGSASVSDNALIRVGSEDFR